MPWRNIKHAEKHTNRAIRQSLNLSLIALMLIAVLAWSAIAIQSRALGAVQSDLDFFRDVTALRSRVDKISDAGLRFAMNHPSLTDIDRMQAIDAMRRDRDVILGSGRSLKELISGRGGSESRKSADYVVQFEEMLSQMSANLEKLSKTQDPEALTTIAVETSQLAFDASQLSVVIRDDRISSLDRDTAKAELYGLEAGVGVTIVSILLMIFVVIPSTKRLKDTTQFALDLATEKETTNIELEEARVELNLQCDQMAESVEYADSQRKMYEAASKRFQALLEGLPAGCLTFDTDGTVREWNQAMSQLLEVDTIRAIHCSLDAVLSELKTESGLNNLVETVAAGNNFPSTDWTITTKSGAHKVLSVSAFPLTNQSGDVYGGITNMVDVTERRLIERELEEKNRLLSALASQDGLTGLMNHITFQKNLEVEFNTGREMAIILLDVDHFKQYNDSFGHPAGDDVLKGVAELMHEFVLPPDVAARYGGEEFAIALFDRSPSEVLDIAEDIRQAFDGRTWPNREITASFGVAFRLPTTRSHRELIELADRGLYQSKARGRNCVSVVENSADAA